MTKIYTLMPDRLNLNGEQGNVLVLKRRIEWLGFRVEVVSVDSVAKLSELITSGDLAKGGSFVFIGQGSLETFGLFEKQKDSVTNLYSQLQQAEIPTLVVGTLFELLASAPKLPEFRSEFVLEKFVGADFDILGYAGTAYQVEAIKLTGSSFIESVLHGPILAKNPKLADWFLSKIGIPISPNKQFEVVDEIIGRIWELELP